jgi:hypothetical protein
MLKMFAEVSTATAMHAAVAHVSRMGAHQQDLLQLGYSKVTASVQLWLAAVVVLTAMHI